MSHKPISFLISLTLAVGLLLGACTPKATPIPTEIIPTEAPAVSPTEVLEPTPTEEPTPEPIVLTDGLGRTVTLESPAQRVVSLAPSNTEILFAIGAGSQVVGRDRFSNYPEEALEVTDIGGGWGELDTETIVSLDPDLVLAASLTPPEQIQALEDLGLTVFALTNPADLEGMYANLLLVAQLTGHEAEAVDLIETLKARVAAVEEKVATVEDRPLVFYELDATDPNAPWTSGPGTFIDTLLTMAGAQNLGADLDDVWVQVSIEELVTKNPDFILLGDATWGGVTPEDVAARAGWDALDAVQNGHVFPFNDDLVSRPGPRLVDGLEALAELLHPDLFK
jgi:iron complex transport system substrate-binding protein